MNNSKTHSADRVHLELVVLSKVASVLDLMDFKISFKVEDVELRDKEVNPLVIYSMSSKRCLVVVEVSREAPQTNNRKDKTSC